jgi:hypothetical protein
VGTVGQGTAPQISAVEPLVCSGRQINRQKSITLRNNNNKVASKYG